MPPSTVRTRTRVVLRCRPWRVLHTGHESEECIFHLPEAVLQQALAHPSIVASGGVVSINVWNKDATPLPGNCLPAQIADTLDGVCINQVRFTLHIHCVQTPVLKF